MLKVQRRMHPEIVEYPNKMFYDGKLDTEYVKAEFEVEPYTIHNVKGICNELGTSYMNEKECVKCIELATELKKKSGDIVIICPYQAQARQILSYGADIEVHTVDSFQGREADIVILSIVRTKECGFWADPRRLCVALTRAKHSLHIVASCDEWQDTLLNLKKDAKARGKLL